MSTKTIVTVKERPILMSAPMVRATLRDVDPKTQTRRVVKLDSHGGVREVGDSRYVVHVSEAATVPGFCPYGKPGDRLWVRETWCLASDEHNGPDDRPDARPLSPDGHHRWCFYAATEPDVEHVDSEVRSPWRPSIHMPRWASRITLEVTGVRVERLQDITDDDAEAEGVRSWAESDDGMSVFNAFRIAVPNNPKFLFKLLWTTINGPESWDANPYVWVIEFKRLEQKDTRP